LFYWIIGNIRRQLFLSFLSYATNVAMKIHVSGTTKELLDHHGGFILEKRGSIEIKVNLISYVKWFYFWILCLSLNELLKETIFIGHFN